MKKLEIQYKPVKDLIPYANNSRTHSEEQIAQIASSIKEFGFTNPILLDGENGIIAGHGRLAGAYKLGMEQVPTIELSHLTKPQKKAYVIADNKLALNSGWDYNVLSVELEDLGLLDYDLGFTGFSQEEIDDVLNGWDSDIEIPSLDDVDEDPLFTLKVQGSEIDKDDIIATVEKAIKESGIEGIKIA